GKRQIGVQLQTVARRDHDRFHLGERKPLELRLSREEERSLLRGAVPPVPGDRAAVGRERDEPRVVRRRPVDDDEVAGRELPDRVEVALHGRIEDLPARAAGANATACTTWVFGCTKTSPASTSEEAARVSSFPVARSRSTSRAVSLPTEVLR